MYLLRKSQGVRFHIFFILIKYLLKNETSIANGEEFAICARTVWNKVKEFNTIGNVIAIGMNCVHPKVRGLINDEAIIV